MRVEVCTCIYNEEFLLPYYLNHYQWVDRINILLDRDTNDNSLKVMQQWSNRIDIKVFPMKMENGFDNIFKIDKLNDLFRSISSEIVFMVDADEFILADREKVESVEDGVHAVYFAQIYRNISDIDLDIKNPSIYQRRHGVIDGLKPILVKNCKDVSWGVGCHECNQPVITKHMFKLAHWCMADPSFCIDRRMHRIARVSEADKERGFCVHLTSSTLESAIQECESHLNDERIW